MYRTLFYVNIYGSYKLSKNSPVFLAHPVQLDSTLTTKHTVFKSVIELSVKCTTKKKRLKMTFETTDISCVVEFIT